MSAQEQFAAWHKKRFGWDYAELGNDDYSLLECWLAAEAAAIERCAQACRELAKELIQESPPLASPTHKQAAGARMCVAVILALRQPAASKNEGETHA